MGLEIDKEDFSKDDHRAFSLRLYESLAALKHQIRKPGFGLGPPKIGAELECYITNRSGQVQALNQEIIAASGDKKLTVELNRFNLELNCEPLEISKKVFSILEQSLLRDLKSVNDTATQFDALVVPIGILPTLQRKHLQPKYMTDIARYRALAKHLHAMRGEDFRINIHGHDQLRLRSPHVALEGANASFQFHLMVPPADFADIFNATQLSTALAVALSANSPILLNKVLWDETRVALFKQSIDSRSPENMDWRRPARVPFGHGWVREDAWELFAEAVAIYPPIFPILSDESPLAAIKKAKVPKLAELCMHTGTTWPWNRAIYSGDAGGHVRIEMRALPSGPSVKDMCANVAFASGLALGLQDNIRDFIAVLPFKFAEYNFYRAAQSGLDAQVIWPHPTQHQLVETSIIDVIANMLPIADTGLTRMGIDKKDRDHYLTIIEARLSKKMTGARWQREQLEQLEQHQRKRARPAACQKMFANYVEQQNENTPVSQWKIYES